jgi:hypothetical protein
MGTGLGASETAPVPRTKPPFPGSPINSHPLAVPRASPPRHTAAKDRTFKTVRPNQGMACGNAAGQTLSA